MPHIELQYSANLDATLRERDVVQRVHEAALATGVFPLGGTRTRALRCDLAAIADGHPDNAFLDVQVRIGAGRDDDTKKRVGETLMETLGGALRDTPHWSSLALSIEIREIDGVFAWRQNTIHERVRERQGEAR